MTEHVPNPFTTYNSTGNVQTLVGNWQEEQSLKEVTGTSRNKTVALQHQAAAEATVFAVRQDGAVAEPTHSRVIEHTEQLLPAEWLAHNTVNFQPPAARTHDLASYPKAKQHGPRQEQELKRLWQEAAEEEAPAPQPASFVTTHVAEFQPRSMDGIQVGARVMRTQDGAPVQRDPTFLAETKILPTHMAQRLMPGSRGSDGAGDNSGNTDGASSSRSSWQGSGLQSWIGDPAVPITLYTEAAAKSTFTGHFYGTATLNKLAPMNRNDNFTKLMGDINKNTEDQ